MKLSTILDLAGLLLLLLGAALAVYEYTHSVSWALACAGVGVLGISYLADRKGKK